MAAGPQGLARARLRRRVLAELALKHRRLVELLRTGHLQPVVGLPVHELLRASLPLAPSLSRLEAPQACVVDLDLLQPGSLRACSGLRLRRCLRRSPVGLSRSSARPRVLPLLVRFLAHDLFHVVYLWLLVLVIVVAAAAAVMADHDLVAPPVDLRDHLVLLRSLRSLVAAAAADCACRLVRRLVLRVPRLLVRG